MDVVLGLRRTARTTQRTRDLGLDDDTAPTSYHPWDLIEVRAAKDAWSGSERKLLALIKVTDWPDDQATRDALVEKLLGGTVLNPGTDSEIRDRPRRLRLDATYIKAEFPALDPAIVLANEDAAKIPSVSWTKLRACWRDKVLDAKADLTIG